MCWLPYNWDEPEVGAFCDHCWHVGRVCQTPQRSGKEAGIFLNRVLVYVLSHVVRLHTSDNSIPGVAVFGV